LRCHNGAKALGILYGIHQAGRYPVFTFLYFQLLAAKNGSYHFCAGNDHLLL